jgi:hypothetical protein
MVIDDLRFTDEDCNRKSVARYIQKIDAGGRERWLGWEIDGIGTEIPGLVLIDGIPEEELQRRGVRRFFPMSFDDFVGLGSATARSHPDWLDQQDLSYRFDALSVALERFFASGRTDIPRAFLEEMFGATALSDPRVQDALKRWEEAGWVRRVYGDACYLKVLRRAL